MQKLRLSEWASIAEIAGTLGVVISLLVVAYSLERNTTVLSSQFVNDMYDANREIGQILLVNPDLSAIIERAQTDVSTITVPELIQFKQYLILNLDIWERAIVRQKEGLIGEQAIAGWHRYYHEFFRRSLGRQMWEELKWNWTDPDLFRRVDAALSGGNP
jgi:hypothetical protein